MTTPAHMFFTEMQKNLSMIDHSCSSSSSSFSTSTSTSPKSSKERLQRILSNSPCMSILVLDEMDAYLPTHRDLLSCIFEWCGSLPLITICISNNIMLMEEFLPQLHIQNIQPVKLVFRAYTQEDLQKILVTRIQEGWQEWKKKQQILLLETEKKNNKVDEKDEEDEDDDMFTTPKKTTGRKTRASTSKKDVKTSKTTSKANKKNDSKSSKSATSKKKSTKSVEPVSAPAKPQKETVATSENTTTATTASNDPLPFFQLSALKLCVSSNTHTLAKFICHFLCFISLIPFFLCLLFCFLLVCQDCQIIW